MNARALGRACALAWACALVCLTPPALAWSASGHMQIASFAYDALSEPQRAEFVALLRQHPRFSQDFQAQVPAELTTDAERARWLFLWASVWPDLVKGQPAYERGPWHYVNLPLSLRAGQLATCAQARAALPESQRRAAAERASRRRAEPSTPAAGAAGSAAQLTPSEPEEIRTAWAWARRTLADRVRPAAERALALAWLLHLVGDAHQPLHAVALFSERRFPFGDRGGNDILAGTLPLHRVWDSLLGDDQGLPFVQQQARGWLADAELRSLAGSAERELEIDPWLDEDCALARSLVYTPAILAAVQRAEGGALDVKPDVSLGEAYLAAARRAAQRRAVQAGARLAAILKGLASPVAPRSSQAP